MAFISPSSLKFKFVTCSNCRLSPLSVTIESKATDGENLKVEKSLTTHKQSQLETGKMTTTHLDVFFHDASSTSISGNITKITLEMYVRSKFDQEGRAFKVHGIKEPPQAPIKLAKWAGSKKLAKLEADLLEILSSG